MIIWTRATWHIEIKWGKSEEQHKWQWTPRARARCHQNGDYLFGMSSQWVKTNNEVAFDFCRKTSNIFTKENNKGSWETEKLENDLCEIRTQLTFSAFNQKSDSIFLRLQYSYTLSVLQTLPYTLPHAPLNLWPPFSLTVITFIYLYTYIFLSVICLVCIM